MMYFPREKEKGSNRSELCFDVYLKLDYYTYKQCSICAISREGEELVRERERERETFS